MRRCSALLPILLDGRGAGCGGKCASWQGAAHKTRWSKHEIRVSGVPLADSGKSTLIGDGRPQGAWRDKRTADGMLEMYSEMQDQW